MTSVARPRALASRRATSRSSAWSAARLFTSLNSGTTIASPASAGFAGPAMLPNALTLSSAISDFPRLAHARTYRARPVGVLYLISALTSQSGCGAEGLQPAKFPLHEHSVFVGVRRGEACLAPLSATAVWQEGDACVAPTQTEEQCQEHGGREADHLDVLRRACHAVACPARSSSPPPRKGLAGARNRTQGDKLRHHWDF